MAAHSNGLLPSGGQIIFAHVGLFQQVPYVFRVKSTALCSSENLLNMLFGVEGRPEQIITDNTTPFSSYN